MLYQGQKKELWDLNNVSKNPNLKKIQKAFAGC